MRLLNKMRCKLAAEKGWRNIAEGNWDFDCATKNEVG